MSEPLNDDLIEQAVSRAALLAQEVLCLCEGQNGADVIVGLSMAIAEAIRQTSPDPRVAVKEYTDELIRIINEDVPVPAATDPNAVYEEARAENQTDRPDETAWPT